MIRLLFAASAVLLLAWDATAAVLGPRFEVPVEWVWRFDPRTRLFVRVSSARDFAVASNGTDFFVAWSQRALVGTVVQVFPNCARNNEGRLRGRAVDDDRQIVGVLQLTIARGQT